MALAIVSTIAFAVFILGFSLGLMWASLAAAAAREAPTPPDPGCEPERASRGPIP